MGRVSEHVELSLTEVLQRLLSVRSVSQMCASYFSWPDSADNVCRIPAGHHFVVVSAPVVRVCELHRVGLLVARAPGVVNPNPAVGATVGDSGGWSMPIGWRRGGGAGQPGVAV